MILAFSSFAGFGLGKWQSSSMWEVGKEGGKCNFLLFDDKLVVSLFGGLPMVL